MLRSLTQAIQARAKGVTVIVLLLITLSVYFYMILATIPSVMSYADGMEILDMQPRGYSIEYAHQLLGALGEQGRHYYLYRQIPVDMIYPFLFAISYSLTLAWVFGRAFDPSRKVNYFILVPVAAGLFDYLENVGIVLMLTGYPDFSAAIAFTTSIFSVAKSLFTSAFFILLIAGGVQILKRRLGRG